MDEVKDPLPNHTIYFPWIPAVGIHVLKGVCADVLCFRVAAVFTMKLANGTVLTTRGCYLLTGVQAISNQVVIMLVQVILILRGTGPGSFIPRITNSTHMCNS